ncbi:hypothetical protein [Campylobacter mucosalis]|uniref:hypothetical protein n=1 Tax=Campylobacter mucosalis TaxID=202 RepID=UPI00146FD668|nr:hypothetical protein [Campylobacter mucosalis]
MRASIFIFILALTLSAGNLNELINLAQSAKKDDILKFSHEISKDITKQKQLDFTLNTRYTFTQKEQGGYATKAGSILLRFEYLLFDGGRSKSLEQMSLLSQTGEIFKSEDYKNFISFEVAKLYFGAITMDGIIKLKQNQVEILKSLSDENSLFYEFLEVGSDENDAINKALLTAKDELFELELKRASLRSSITLLSNGEIDFKAGSTMQMPIFTDNIADLNLHIKEQNSVIYDLENETKKSKNLPKIYLKDSQSLNNNSFKQSKGGTSETISKYLDANKPVLELKWDLPNSITKSKQRQEQEATYQKQLLELNDKTAMIVARLQALKEIIIRLEASTKIDEVKSKRLQKSLKNVILSYSSGYIKYDEFLFLLEDNIAEQVGFLLDMGEFQIRKLEYFFEQKDDITKRIQDE